MENNDLQKRYDDLLYYYNKRGDKLEKLEKQFNELNSELCLAKNKIHEELEPRIESEKRRYDNYVSNGHGDECFSNGDSGKCGYECSCFGKSDECYNTDITKEELLYIYENIEVDNEGLLLELIEKNNLLKETALIDIKKLKNEINSYKQKIKQLEIELLEKEKSIKD